MWHNGIVRRVNVAASWKRAREQFAAVKAERDQLRQDLAESERQRKVLKLKLDWANSTLRERDQLREAVLEMRAAIDARQAAEERLAELHREREIVRARAAERPPGQLLH